MLIEGNKIFAGCDGFLYALDSANGKVLWENGLQRMGRNEVALAKQGTSTQFITRVVKES